METNKTRRAIDRLVTALLPLAFIGSGFLNMYAFVLDGHRHEWFRQAFVLGIQGVAALLFFWKVVKLWRQRREARGLMLRAALIPLAFAAVFLAAMAFHPHRAAAILKTGVVEGAYLMSAWCAVLILALERRLASFLDTCRLYGLALLPIAVYYCARFYLPSADYGVRNFGVMSYMTLAYALFQSCLFALAARMLRSETDTPLRKWVDFVLLTVFSVAITLSGTRGTMVCLLAAGVLAALWPFYAKRPKSELLGALGAIVLALALFSTVCYPATLGQNSSLTLVQNLAGEQVPVQRPLEEVYEKLGLTEDEEIILFVKTGEALRAREAGRLTLMEYEAVCDDVYLRTGLTENLGRKWTEEELERFEQLALELGLAEEGTLFGGSVVDAVKSGRSWAEVQAGRLSEEDYAFLWESAYKLNQTGMGARTMLWGNTLRELKAAPLTGQGLMFFQMKYGTYPHNLFLELGTDFGLFIMVFVLVLGLWVFLRMIGYSKDRPEIAAVTLYVIAQIPQDMISGTCYSYTVFLKYGFCILLAGCLWGRRKSLQTKVGSGVNRVRPQNGETLS